MGSSLDNVPHKCHLPSVALEKYEKLQTLLRSYGSCLVAYSGGVDSAFLACVGHQVLGDKCLAAIADSPSLPRRELAEALSLAQQFKFPVRVVRTREFENPDYLANPNNRCYFCKQELFAELAPLAAAEGYAVLAYGENASDVGDFRPGAQAAAQFQVRAPLKEAGLTKSEIRQLSAKLGLPTADKPQMACLSSRIPYGEAVSPEKLTMIEQAENILRDLGFYITSWALPRCLENLLLLTCNPQLSSIWPALKSVRMKCRSSCKTGPRLRLRRHSSRLVTLTLPSICKATAAAAPTKVPKAKH
jgi:uncharacterized protein